MAKITILDEVKRFPELSHIQIDRDSIMRSIGVNLSSLEYTPLSSLGMDDLPDLQFKSLMWLEYLNEILSTAEKEYLDQNLETERVYSTSVKLIMSQNTSYRVTEAKAHAKTHPDYIAHMQKLHTLKAYTDYLERLIDNINKYHYTIKGRIEGMKQVERKY